MNIETRKCKSGWETISTLLTHHFGLHFFSFFKSLPEDEENRYALEKLPLNLYTYALENYAQFISTEFEIQLQMAHSFWYGYR